MRFIVKKVIIWEITSKSALTLALKKLVIDERKRRQLKKNGIVNIDEWVNKKANVSRSETIFLNNSDELLE